MERITDFIQHFWFMITQASLSERFLLQILLIFAAIDFLTGDFLLGAIELAVVFAAAFFSYRELLWFDDNIDDVDLKDVIDLLRESDYARNVIAGEFVQSQAVNNGMLTPGEDLKIALHVIEQKIGSDA